MAKACTGQRPPGLSSYLSLEPEFKAMEQIAVPCRLACKLGGDPQLDVAVETRSRHSYTA